MSQGTRGKKSNFGLLLILVFFFAYFAMGAEAEKKWYVYDFTATWCSPCKKMNSALQDARVQDSLKEKNITVIKIDIDKFPDIKRSWGVTSIPHLILVYKDNNKVYKDAELIGLQPQTVESILQLLNKKD